MSPRTFIKVMLETLVLALPFWLLIVIVIYILPTSTIEEITRFILLPGIILRLIFNPTWDAMHNTPDYVYLILNFIFYYVFFLIIKLYKRRH